MIAVPHAPPFRADQVGSLLRPAHLIEAREQRRKRLLSDDELRVIEDEAIREVVARQEAAGLRVVSDGEFRRQNYIVDFFRKALGSGGLKAEPGDFVHRNARGDTIPVEKLVIHKPLRWTGPIFAEHLAFVRSITQCTPKMTVPSPIVLHFMGGNDAILRDAYSSLDGFWADVIEVYRQEFAALHAAGCTYLQIDETSLVKFGDPEIRAVLERRGEDWRTLVETYVEVINAVIATAPAGMTVGIHVCRGNRLGFWQADAGYEFMADQLFRRLDARFYFLEFDSPRAGPIDALKYMPEDKTVALGLVTTKSPDLEQPEMLRARIQEASAFVSLDRLCLSPQCGFSGNVGNTVMTADQQFAKLRLLVETARSVWADA
ncbi:MAG: 5-methyltetrahydropteroyltriglutamate--homocysteine S-methyltransferase [bacterium]